MSLALNFLKLRTKGVLINLATRTLSSVSTNPVRNSSVIYPLKCINNNWIWQKPYPIRLPLKIVPEIKSPDFWPTPSIIEPLINAAIIDDPLPKKDQAKEAARLIVIRRKKMKKHKLKKLRKRLKYERAKIRQRREHKKEKEFQAVLTAQCKVGEGFSAEEYVADKLKQYNEKPPIPFYLTDEYKELLRIKDLRLNVKYDYKK